MNPITIDPSGRAPPAKKCRRLAQDLVGTAPLFHFLFEKRRRALSSESCAAGALRRLAPSRHQRRSVSVVQPVLPAIEVKTALSEASSALPGVCFGHNADMAWALAIFYADQQDLVIEPRCTPSREIHEAIAVKGA